MIAPRWRKALADIGVRPGRSALAVLAMTVGVWALATLAFKQAILRPVIESMYGATEPASATLFVDDVDDALVEAVKRVPGVGDAEARPVIMARLRVGAAGDDAWIPAFLYVIRDFEAQRMSLIEPGSGAWPPADGEVLLERSAVQVARAAPGDDLTLRIPGGGARTLRVAGTVHAAGLAPAWMEHVVYGFVPWTSLAREGEHRESGQLLVRVAEHPLEEGHIREVVDRVKDAIEAGGGTVRRVVVPEPGRHPHADQMNTFMYLVGAFGLLAFLLSAALVSGMIHALQSEQIRQVGVMKALGATRGQVAGVYLAHVGLLAAAAALVGVPLGWVTGSAYARFSAGILNADVSRTPFPLTTLLIVLVVGIVVPVLTAMIPVWRSSRVTVREALAGDAGDRPPVAGIAHRWTARLRLPRPITLVLRNTLVRRGRLALTVGMLAVGGAMFMAALNASAAWDRATREEFARRRYDIMLWLAAPQPVPALDALFETVPDVARAEYWPGASPYLIGPGGAPGREVALLGVPEGSALLDPEVTSGRWLDPAVPDGAVINPGLLAMFPSLAVGDTVAVRLDGRTRAFPIAGIVKELLPQPIVYAPRAAVLAAIGDSGTTARTARIVTRAHDSVTRNRAARDIEAAFEKSGIEVARLFGMDDMRGAVLDHLVIIQTILVAAAAIVVLVGGIGLASTLGISVVQRTREIGVMSAIGATPWALALGVWSESVVIAVLSWLAALALSVPASAVIQTVTGNMFFKAPLALTLSGEAALAWLALVLVLATVGSIQPCLRVARLTVREAIAHA